MALTREEYLRTEHLRSASPPPARGSRLTEGLPLPPDEDWMARAACRNGEDPTGAPWANHSVWHSPHLHFARVVRAATQRCGACPVAEQCAADDDGHDGIRAGNVRQPYRTFDRVCRVCGVTFVASNAGGRSRKVCSDESREARERVRHLTSPDEKLVSGPAFLRCFGDRSDDEIAAIIGAHPLTVARWRAGRSVKHVVLARLGITAAQVRAGWRYEDARAIQ